MRFQLGAIPGSPDFEPDATWHSVREPSPWVFQLMAMPIGVGTAVVVACLWSYVTPLPALTSTVTWSSILIAFVGLVVVHELLHAVVHPFVGLSSQTTLGFWPSRILFYAHYDGEMSRNRFVAILLMPLSVITFVPLVAAALFQMTCDWAAAISSLNALLACGDILGAAMVLIQIPASATVRNKEWRTFWRKYDESAA